MVIHRLTNQTVGSETYLQESTYRVNVEGNHEGTKCWRVRWAVQRGSQGKAWAVLDLTSLNGHLRILFICPEIPDGLKLKEKYLHTYPKNWDVERKTNISTTSRTLSDMLTFSFYKYYKGDRKWQTTCWGEGNGPCWCYCEQHHQNGTSAFYSWFMQGWQLRRPLLVNNEMTTRWRPGGRGSGQHTGVLTIHVLHVHGICTYAALIVKSGFFRHVVIRWQGWWYSDRLPLESEEGATGNIPSGCI